MEPDQQQRFREAVDRKSDQARRASHQAPRHAGHEEGVPVGDTGTTQPGLEDRPQDAISVRDKNSGHGKKTADKWNQ